MRFAILEAGISTKNMQPDPYSYTIRAAERADLQGIGSLWDRLAPNWGFSSQLIEWAGRNPAGPPLIVLAELTDGTIAGHLAFRPGVLRVGNRETLTARAGAVIVSPTLRTWLDGDGRPANPVFGMYSFGCDLLRARGFGSVYMLPDARWVRLLQMMPNLVRGSFPLHSLKLPLERPFDLGSDIRVSVLTNWDARIDRLFEATAGRFGSIVRRDSETLSWLVGSATGTFDVLGIERDGELIGVVASQERGDFQWLIADMLTVDGQESLALTLKAVANHAHGKVGDSSTRKPIRKVALLQLPGFADVTASLGFARDQYDFPMVVTRLDSSIATEDIIPERWYVSATE